MDEKSPTVLVIARPNGAGKTTFAKRYLPEFAEIGEFLNADMIAAGLSPFNPAGQAFLAGKLKLTRFDELSKSRVSFGFESTLARRTHQRRLAHMKADLGYRVIIVFLWLPSAVLAVLRVAGRVTQGGHDIPESVIRRRFAAGLSNFANRYSQIADEWFVYNAVGFPLVRICRWNGSDLTISNLSIYDQFRETVPEL